MKQVLLIITMVLVSSPFCSSSLAAPAQKYYSATATDSSGQKIKVNIPVASKDQLQQSAPSAIKQLFASGAKFGAKTTLHFTAESLTFYSVMGMYAIMDCTLFYQKNPGACMDYLAHSVDPMGYVSFAAFMIANHATLGVGNLAAKNSIFAATGFGSKLIWSNLGLAAGSLGSAFVDEALHDDDIRLVSSFMWRNKTTQDQVAIDKAWENIDKKWFTVQGLNRFTPQVMSLISAAMTSSYVAGVIEKSAFEKVVIEGGKKVVTLRPLVAELPILRTAGGVLRAISMSRWLSGGWGIVIFELASRTVGPVVDKGYNNTVHFNKYNESREFMRSSLEPSSVHEFGEVGRQWRKYIQKQYIEEKSKWDNYTAKFFSDIESTHAFYKNFLKARKKLKISNDPRDSEVIINAIESNTTDWENASNFSINKLEAMTKLNNLGVSKDFYSILSELDLKDVVQYLDSLSKIDLDLAVKSINAGISLSKIKSNSREILQNELKSKLDSKDTLALTSYEPEGLISTDSKMSFSNRLSAKPIKGKVYRNMSEKLLISMICGPDAGPSSEDQYSKSILGFGAPEFYPPNLISNTDLQKKVCKANTDSYTLINEQNSPISLINFALKYVDKNIREETFDKWFEAYVFTAVSPMIGYIEQRQTENLKKNLIPVLNKNRNALLPIKSYLALLKLQYTMKTTPQSDYTGLPLGVLPSMDLTRRQLIDVLIWRSPKKARADIMPLIEIVESLMTGLPSKFKVAEWEEFIKLVDLNNPTVKIRDLKPIQIHHILLVTTLNQIEANLTEFLAATQISEAQRNMYKIFYNSILDELKQLSSEAVEIDRHLGTIDTFD